MRFPRWLNRLFIGPYTEPKRASFPVDPKLEQRIADARLPENSVKAIHDWPRDGTGSPIDWDDYEAPIG